MIPVCVGAIVGALVIEVEDVVEGVVGAATQAESPMTSRDQSMPTAGFHT